MGAEARRFVQVDEITRAHNSLNEQVNGQHENSIVAVQRRHGSEIGRLNERLTRENRELVARCEALRQEQLLLERSLWTRLRWVLFGVKRPVREINVID